MALASPASEISSAKSRTGNLMASVFLFSRQTHELAVFGVAHVLLQQRITPFACNYEGAGGIRLCETECTELRRNISRNWGRIAFRICGALQLPQPVKIVRSQVRVHDQLKGTRR